MLDNTTSSSTPSSSTTSQPDKETLGYWGVPKKVQKRFLKQAGISQLYPWQVECLSMPGIIEGGNLVYCAPTSGGKTLVAEILIIRSLLISKKKVLFVQPFQSIVAERVAYLTAILADSMGITIRGL